MSQRKVLTRHPRVKLLSLATLFVSLFASLGFVLTIHDFLAITRPVDTNILLVEGWVWPSPALKEAADEFNRGHYKWLVTMLDQQSSAEVAARRLHELGVDENRIVVLPIPELALHRTFASALMLRSWLAKSKTEIIGVNVFTLGPHARKSFVAFTRVLGPGTNVGVIAGTEDTFNSSRWWMSARGIYVIGRKTLGYLYAVLWPLPEGSPLSSQDR